MGRFFQTITENNKWTLNKPADSDLVYYSELNDWFTYNAFRSFSLKYVVDRCIYYKVGKKEHAVGQGNFLLACKQPGVEAYFDSKKTVRSICIDICPSTVAEAFTVLHAKDDLEFDNYLDRHFRIPEFFESVCPVQSAQFGQKLNSLVEAIGNGVADQSLSKEWFLDLIESVIFHEYGNYLALNGINSVKPETRKEILRRLNGGRRFMDEAFLEINEIIQVAQFCNMSEFHFFRSFKQAFRVSPYQYLLNRRLDLANKLLLEKKMSVTVIASHCNFPDIFTFSKAFKRRYGVPPSSVSSLHR